MAKQGRKTVRFRGREEKVLETISVRRRPYFVLEKLSRREAYRVFDPRGGPHGDYRVLYRIPFSRATNQRIEVLRALSGPTANTNFPVITDCARQANELFVVMTWVWGTNLREYVRQVRGGSAPRPSTPALCRLVRGLAHGLSHYHRRANVVHGDVSPANIVLTSGTTKLVLVDFGSAWPVERSASKEPADGVTIPYAAPERIARHALEDFRADVFSLAVVFYEMLTLEIPFEGAGGQAGVPNLAEAYADSFAPPSSRIADAGRLPRRSVALLDDVVRKSLALHPDGRFATRSEWLDAYDELDRAMRKGDRLTRLDRWLIRGISRLFLRPNTNQVKPD